MAQNNEEDKKMTFSTKQQAERIKGYSLPTYTCGKESYVSYYAFDPESGKMKRKKIMLGRIKGAKARKKYAQQLIQRLIEELEGGFNPWIEAGHSLEYRSFKEVTDMYRQNLRKMLSEDYVREETFCSYSSYLKIFTEWAADAGHIIYIYQLNRQKVSQFLDYILIDRNCTVQTQNNYLAWLKVFCGWLLKRCYLSTDPTAGISMVKKRRQPKNRCVIPDSELVRLHDHLMASNRHYMLACYLLHYMFIRPREMSFVKVGDIHVKKQTLVLHGDHTKNHNDAIITIPAKIIRLMNELHIFDSPSEYFLFSEDFRPGRWRKPEKSFRDYWLRYVARPLGWPASYKFYSLKDTGITNMLKANTDVISVRDQARHSSILITDTYTPKDIGRANALLMNYDGVL